MAATDKKGPNILGALMDLLILVLLVGAAGFGGYYLGTMQKMAPIQAVAPGTPGAITAVETKSTPAAELKSASSENKSAESKKPESSTTKSTEKDPVESTEESAKKTEKLKYWICSSGSDYMGYAITVKVNGKAVDNFFGPDKTIDITKMVKSGDNTITFEAKNLGASYNKHKGDEQAELLLQVVSGPYVQENF
ncbi:MAG: hypothetical protein K2X27_24410, partial [Candidatus Obscuribacterales bacterium]|nr:hypothetical protein [Candidatus Obscuribacterales bacterium]